MSTDERPAPLDGPEADPVSPLLIDVLAADARISKAFVMEDVRLESDRERIRERFRQLRKSGTVTNAEAAKALGVPKPSFSQIVNDTYPANGRGRDRIDKVLKSLDQWMAQRDSIAEAPSGNVIFSVLHASGRVAVALGVTEAGEPAMQLRSDDGGRPGFSVCVPPGKTGHLGMIDKAGKFHAMKMPI